MKKGGKLASWRVMFEVEVSSRRGLVDDRCQRLASLALRQDDENKRERLDEVVAGNSCRFR
jgi:hypothetical protein